MNENLITLPWRFQQQYVEIGLDAVRKTAVVPRKAETLASIDFGQPPSSTVYTENILELVHYDADAAGITSEEQHAVPILIVYALINRRRSDPRCVCPFRL